MEIIVVLPQNDEKRRKKEILRAISDLHRICDTLEEIGASHIEMNVKAFMNNAPSVLGVDQE